MTHQYLPHTNADVKAMLDVCEAKSLEDLYKDVPDGLRMKHPYALPESLSEKELRDYFSELDSRNQHLICFAGAGFYEHYTPAAVNSILSRSEFLTAYTPYQPEISQGTLQYIFEYQSMMCELTGMDISNASMYDGATATAEAMIMAVNAVRKKRRVLISSLLNPAVAEVVSTYARYHGITLEVIPSHEGVTDRAAFEEMMGAGDVAGVILGYPNYYGVIEPLDGWADICHNAKALMILNCQASTLAVLRSPASLGADIVCGDAQSFGMPLNYGGPYLGYLCTTKALMRKLPGRIVGATTDAKGQRVFVLTLQAREQHIRREKATSNICSNQGLMALHTAVYLSLMGSEGLRQINDLGYGGLRYLADGLAATGKLKMTYPELPVINEALFTVSDPLTADDIIGSLSNDGILAGVKVDESHLLIAVTEMQSKADIDKYINLIDNLR